MKKQIIAKCLSNPEDKGRKLYRVTVGRIHTQSFLIYADNEVAAIKEVRRNLR